MGLIEIDFGKLPSYMAVLPRIRRLFTSISHDDSRLGRAVRSQFFIFIQYMLLAADGMFFGRRG